MLHTILYYANPAEPAKRISSIIIRLAYVHIDLSDPNIKQLKQMKQDGVCNWLHNESGYMRKDLWQEFIEDFIK